MAKQLNRGWGRWLLKKGATDQLPAHAVLLRSAVLMPDSALGYQFAAHGVNGDICPQHRLQTAVECTLGRGFPGTVVDARVDGGLESQ
jgi:hypothetical protein